MQILGISGKARSGKTTLANELAARFGWNHLSLASVLKAKARTEFGLTEDQVNGEGKEKPCHLYHSDGVTPMVAREVLIRLGLLYRSIDPMFWIRQLEAQIDSTRVNVISDVRFINEANWINDKGGILVRLNRAVELRGGDIDDPSETQLDNYPRFSLVTPESWNVDATDIPPLAMRVQTLVEQFYARSIVA